MRTCLLGLRGFDSDLKRYTGLAIFFLLFLSVLWLGPFLVHDGNGADVTPIPRSVNPYGVTFVAGINGAVVGTVTPLNNQLLGSIFEKASDGSITFDCTQRERQQIKYLYQVQSYGNGTLTLKFQLDITPSAVIAPNSASSTLGPTSIQTITYTTNTLTTLELDFLGPPPSISIPSAIAVAAGFFALLVVIYFAAALAVLVIMLDQENRPSLGFITKFGIASLVAIVFALITLLILASFTGFFKGLGL